MVKIKPKGLKWIKKSPVKSDGAFLFIQYIYLLLRFVVALITVHGYIIAGLRDMLLIMAAETAETVLIIILVAKML